MGFQPSTVCDRLPGRVMSAVSRFPVLSAENLSGHATELSTTYEGLGVDCTRAWGETVGFHGAQRVS